MFVVFTLTTAQGHCLLCLPPVLTKLNICTFPKKCDLYASFFFSSVTDFLTDVTYTPERLIVQKIWYLEACDKTKRRKM